MSIDFCSFVIRLKRFDETVWKKRERLSEGVTGDGAGDCDDGGLKRRRTLTSSGMVSGNDANTKTIPNGDAHDATMSVLEEVSTLVHVPTAQPVLHEAAVDERQPVAGTTHKDDSGEEVVGHVAFLQDVVVATADADCGTRVKDDREGAHVEEAGEPIVAEMGGERDENAVSMNDNNDKGASDNPVEDVGGEDADDNDDITKNESLADAHGDNQGRVGDDDDDDSDARTGDDVQQEGDLVGGVHAEDDVDVAEVGRALPVAERLAGGTGNEGSEDAAVDRPGDRGDEQSAVDPGDGEEVMMDMWEAEEEPGHAAPSGVAEDNERDESSESSSNTAEKEEEERNEEGSVRSSSTQSAGTSGVEASQERESQRPPSWMSNGPLIRRRKPRAEREKEWKEELQRRRERSLAQRAEAAAAAAAAAAKQEVAATSGSDGRVDERSSHAAEEQLPRTPSVLSPVRSSPTAGDSRPVASGPATPPADGRGWQLSTPPAGGWSPSLPPSQSPYGSSSLPHSPTVASLTRLPGATHAYAQPMYHVPASTQSQSPSPSFTQSPPPSQPPPGVVAQHSASPRDIRAELLRRIVRCVKQNQFFSTTIRRKADLRAVLQIAVRRVEEAQRESQVRPIGGGGSGSGPDLLDTAVLRALHDKRRS